MSHLRTILGLAGLLIGLQISAAGAQPPRNVIMFIPDGLRALSVTPQSAPTMAAVRDQGVNFANSHSLFPTFTMANASGMSTGHYLGDSGIFSNTLYSGYPLATAGGSVTPFIENDAVLGDIDEHFSGNFVNEDTVLKAARMKGLSTAAIGKLGPVLMWDHTERSGEKTIIVDDATGSAHGIPLSQAMKDAMTAAGLPLTTPGRGDNGKAGNFEKPGTLTANVAQQAYFADVAAKVVLPMFKARNKPFVLVFWSRDPDGSQHNQGDSFLKVSPGINGPTSGAAIKNADDNLKTIRDALNALGLADTTDIVISADHGFATISKESDTSAAAKLDYKDVPKGLLPPGFLALDLAKALELPLADPDAKNAPVGDNAHPSRGNGLIGKDPARPDVVVASNGGSDLVYLPNKDRALARKVVDALLKQDYVSGLFVSPELGSIPGTLSLNAINLQGSALTPKPAIVVNFRSYATGCDEPTLCTVEVADTGLQQGQGMHGSFSRAETRNFMAAAGPSFRKGFVDRAPVSNADVGKTLAYVLGLVIKDKGKLIGRVMTETLPGGRMPQVRAKTVWSDPAPGGLVTILKTQHVGNQAYFDAAGFAGRTVGLEDGAEEHKKAASR
ncbi:MAG TPA: alkaline phosphatase family protein [Pseudolabrys sp.]|nr:alkaline phosphatase family protein [Pseudolabrys sp.]